MADDFVSKIGFQYDPSAIQKFVSDVAQVNQGLVQTATAAGRFNSAADSVKTSVTRMLGATTKATTNVTSFGDGVQRASVSINEAVPAANAASAAISSLGERFQSVGRIVTGVVLARSLGYLTQAFNESVAEAYKFERAVANIQSIAYEAGVATEQWSEQLFQLSSSFNIAPVEVAEAAYQALQNQVVTGADTFKFMEQAAKLATVTVSDLGSSVEALTGVINAYGLSSSQAERISQQLFVAQRDGRFSLDDIAKSLGSTAIIASQANISFEELAASFVVLTRQGIAPTEALTALRNVIEKIIRPTDEMKKAIFEAFGTAPIEALNQFGLIGFLEEVKKLSGEGSKGLAEFADLWGRIRSVTGAVGITKEVDEVRKSYENLNGAALQFNEALKIITGDRSFRIGQELQEFSNNVTKQFGKAVLSIAEFADKIVDISDSLTGLTKVVGTAAIVGIPAFFLRVSLNAATSAATIAKLKAAFESLQLVFMASGFRGLATSMAALPFGTLISGAALLGAGLGYVYTQVTKTSQAMKEMKRDGLIFAGASDDQFIKISDAMAAVSNQKFDTVQSSFSAAMQGMTRNLQSFTGALDRNIAKQQELQEFSNQLKSNLAGRSAEIERRKGNFVGQADILNREAFSVLNQIARLAKQDVVDVKQINRLDNIFNSLVSQLDNAKARFGVNGQIISAEQQVTRLLEARRNIDTELVNKLDGQDSSTQKQLDLNVQINQQLQQAAANVQVIEGNIKSSTEALRDMEIKAQAVQAALRSSVTGEPGAAADKAVQQLPVSGWNKRDSEEQVRLITQAKDAFKSLREEFERAASGPGTLNTSQLDGLIAKFQSLKTALDTAPQQTAAVENLRKSVEQINTGLAQAKNEQQGVQDKSIELLQKMEGFDIGRLNQQIVELTNKLTPALEKGLENAGPEAAQNMQQLLNIANQIQQIRSNFDSVQESQSSAVQASSEAWNATMEAGAQAAENIKAQAQAALQTAQQALQTALQAQAAAGAAQVPLRQYVGGPVRRFATGGVATDRIPSMLSPGEFVMSSRAAASFFPQIVAMNSGAKTPRFSSGGSVTVGDVNVTVAGGNTSEKTARAIANELRREIKRGLVRLE